MGDGAGYYRIRSAAHRSTPRRFLLLLCFILPEAGYRAGDLDDGPGLRDHRATSPTVNHGTLPVQPPAAVLAIRLFAGPVPSGPAGAWPILCRLEVPDHARRAIRRWLEELARDQVDGSM